jgi:two-component system, LytTR family, sensor kinase
LLILVGSIFTFLVGLSDLNFKSFQIYMLLSLIVRAFLAVNLIFIAELLLFRKINLGEIRVIFVFLITSIVFILVASPDWPHMLFSGKDLNMKVDDWSHFGFSWPKVFSLQILLGLAFLRSLYIFLNDRYKSLINEKDVELARINELHKHAELQSLQAKINPHFLYNALNSIASLASTDSKKTEQMALSLSDFFKYAINREQKQFNSLSEELNAIRTYLEIEKVRFGERLNFEIDCPEELLDIQIPQLLIQPLVENAIKHGLSQITEKGMIRISISKEEKQLKIRIYDNGPAFPDEPISGYGIQNTQERISLLYGEKASINWHNGDEKYIEISLPVNSTL